MDKRRIDVNVSEVMHLLGDVSGSPALALDDIIDTAGTRCAGADALKEARKISPTEAARLILKRYFHIGFAVDTDQGLIVPVIRDADKKSLLEIAGELAELGEKARGGKLRREDIEGGCFSISSLGSIGGTAFTPIVNAPEVAILGVSKAEMKPKWNGHDFEPRLMLPLSLSYDHRVIDGAMAVRFTRPLAETVENLRGRGGGGRAAAPRGRGGASAQGRCGPRDRAGRRRAAGPARLHSSAAVHHRGVLRHLLRLGELGAAR